MHSDGCEQPGVGFCQFDDSFTGSEIDSRYQDVGQSSRPGSIQNLAAIGVKLLQVQMAVRIGEVHGSGAG